MESQFPLKPARLNQISLSVYKYNNNSKQLRVYNHDHNKIIK